MMSPRQKSTTTKYTLQIILCIMTAACIHLGYSVTGYAYGVSGLIQPETSTSSELSVHRQSPTCPDEIALPGLATAPISHEPYYRSEYELFGYDPAFAPNVISFAPDGTPFIRDRTRIQRFNQITCSWDIIDLVPVINEYFPEWDPACIEDNGLRDLESHQIEHRVVFDSSGDAYTFIPSKYWPGIHTSLLLHSSDHGDSWQVYPIPNHRHARMEFQDGHNEIIGPPLLVTMEWSISDIAVIAPTKNEDGTLQIPEPITLSESAGSQGHQSSNLSITVNGVSYIVWADLESGGNDGTPIYIASYNHADRSLSSPRIIGYGGTGEPNNHNIPSITVDSTGILHVLFGAHNGWFKYTRSLSPYNIDGAWSPPMEVPNNDPACVNNCEQYTYVHMVMDQEDTLHLVARWSGDTPGLTYFFRLSYLRKPDGDVWESRKSLVVPFRNFYSNWYHKLSIDNQGRLFVFYVYYGNQLFEDEVDEYDRKWPGDRIRDGGILPENCVPTLESYCWYSNVRAHDPVILMSEDGGDTWAIADSCNLGMPTSLRSACPNNRIVFLPIFKR